MLKYNPKNERIKREYFILLTEALGRSKNTKDNVRQAIDRFETFTKYEDFRKFNKHIAMAFKRKFSEQKSKQSRELISKSTYTTTLRYLKDFFKWLRFKPGYKKIDIDHIEYLNPKESELQIARYRKIKKCPTLDQIKAVLASIMPKNEIEMRNRAIIAFTILTGMRDGAIASLKLKHIHLDQSLVTQQPDEVKTKFSKSINTFFFPVGDEIKDIVVDWVNYLYKEKQFNDDDPVFPRTKMTHNSNFEFMSDGIESYHWKNADPIRDIFKKAFSEAGIEYFNPHSFRKTLGRIGQKICKNAEEYKAWSQNLGHENVLTTLMSYGQVDDIRQGDIIKNLSMNDSTKSQEEMIREMYQNYKKKS